VKVGNGYRVEGVKSFRGLKGQKNQGEGIAWLVQLMPGSAFPHVFIFAPKWEQEWCCLGWDILVCEA
jgi:hypothetical protein